MSSEDRAPREELGGRCGHKVACEKALFTALWPALLVRLQSVYEGECGEMKQCNCCLMVDLTGNAKFHELERHFRRGSLVRDAGQKYTNRIGHRVSALEAAYTQC